MCHRIAVFTFLVLMHALAIGATGAAPTAGDDRTTLETVTKTLDGIAQLRANVDGLHLRIPKAEGIERRIYERRLEREWSEIITKTHLLAGELAKLEKDGNDSSLYAQHLADLLPRIDDALKQATQRVREQIAMLSPVEMTTGAAQLAEIYFRRSQLLNRLVEMLRTRAESMQLMAQFVADSEHVARSTAELEGDLADAAERMSLALEIAQDDVQAATVQLRELPDNQELQALKSVLLGRVNQLAAALHTVIPALEELDLDATMYRQQVILATGQISNDLLDRDLMTNLVSQAIKDTSEWLSANGSQLIVKTIVLISIIVSFWFLARLVSALVQRAMSSDRFQTSQLLRDISRRFTRHLVLLFGILIALSQIGVAVGPVLAGLGVAGFVIGFALQDTLSNFAAGIMILFYRPFDVGDVVETGDVFGKVEGMSLVNSTFLTFDNQLLVVPNSKIWGGVIKNVTAQTTRRVDMTFGISYTDDVDHAERVLLEILGSTDKVLDDPEPIVKLHQLADSSVNFIVRPWVNRDDYWDVYWYVTREVKRRFDQEGISIPFPQRDVHLYQA